MYSSSDDIYKEVVEDSDDDWLLGLVAFAVVEDRRVEWAKHFKENKGRSPNSDEVADWYMQQPKSAIVRARAEAEAALQEYAEEVVETYQLDYGDEIRDGIIVNEVRSISRFMPQFGVSLAASLASAVVLAALLGIIAFLIFSDTSAVEIGKNLAQQTEVQSDGEE